MTDKWTERLSEYIDGELTRQETEQLEAHLMECADCGRTLQELRTVVARAGQVIDRPSANDLWAGILSRIETPQQDVVPMPRTRRFSFSVPQLAAASVALMLLSSGTMYLMMSRTTPEPAVASAPVTQQQETQPQPATQLAAQTETVTPNAPAETARVTTNQLVAAQPVPVKSPAAENYHVAITDLENALEEGRARLDTATVRVLEKNLAAIDAAIVEAQNALARDPGNMYLNRYLDQTMQRKIQLLRRATGIIRAQT